MYTYIRIQLYLDRYHLQDGGVDRVERLLFGITDVAQPNVCGEAGRERVAANGGRGVHRGDDLDVLQPHEVEVLVVESLA